MTASPLKTAPWLLQNLPNVRVLDCRYALSDPLLGRIAYLEGHIPGAIYADLETDLSGPVQPGGQGGRHPLPEPQVLADWLGTAGIGNDSVVVCYDDPQGGQGFAAARAWWLLRWLGHQEVYVLDGGWPAWQAAGGAVSTEETQLTPATFTPHVQTQMLATAADVAARDAGTWLVDSRAPQRYSGETEPLDRKAGHIPGAVNVPERLFHNDGLRTWKSAGEIREVLFDAGLTPDNVQGAIIYSGSGNHSALALAAMHDAGFTGLRHYVGGWSQWSANPKNPVERGDRLTVNG